MDFTNEAAKVLLFWILAIFLGFFLKKHQLIAIRNLIIKTLQKEDLSIEEAFQKLTK